MSNSVRHLDANIFPKTFLIVPYVSDQWILWHLNMPSVNCKLTNIILRPLNRVKNTPRSELFGAFGESTTHLRYVTPGDKVRFH